MRPYRTEKVHLNNQILSKQTDPKSKGNRPATENLVPAAPTKRNTPNHNRYSDCLRIWHRAE